MLVCCLIHDPSFKILQFHVGNNSHNLALTDLSGTTGWELALVTTPSNHTSQAPDRIMVRVTTSSLFLMRLQIIP